MPVERITVNADAHGVPPNKYDAFCDEVKAMALVQLTAQVADKGGQIVHGTLQRLDIRPKLAGGEMHDFEIEYVLPGQLAT